MNDAELRDLCSRHGIPHDQGEAVLGEVKAALLPARPRGIGLPPSGIGAVMEIIAHTNDILYPGPYQGAEFVATAAVVIAWLRDLGNRQL